MIIAKDILNTSPWTNDCHLTYDIFKWIFLNEIGRILIEISLKFVPKGPIHKNSAFVQVMAWRWRGNKPLLEPTVGRMVRAY